MCPVDAMEEEELCVGPAGVLLADSGGCACYLVSWLAMAADGGTGAAERVEVEDARSFHDEDRHAKKLVRANAYQSFTSRSALQARWNNE